MTEQAVDLSVVVVNWNGGEGLQACLRSVRAAAQGLSAEIWLVDNASTDASAGAAVRSFPALRLIQNRENAGFACAANQALSQASGIFVLLLNPDAQIGAEALARLLEVMRSDPSIGIAGCSSVDREGRRVPGYETSFPGQRRRLVPQASGPGRDVAWVSGACLLARRALCDQIGLLDPGFFMYYEDVDWCCRARAAGWRVVTVPEAEVRHDLGGSARRVPPAETARRTASSRLRFYRKHCSPARARWLAFRTAASDSARRLRQLGRRVRLPQTNHPGEAQ